MPVATPIPKFTAKIRVQNRAAASHARSFRAMVTELAEKQLKPQSDRQRRKQIVEHDRSSELQPAQDFDIPWRRVQSKTKMVCTVVTERRLGWFEIICDLRQFVPWSYFAPRNDA